MMRNIFIGTYIEKLWIYKFVFAGYSKLKFLYRDYLISDRKAITIRFRRAFGYTLDIENPQTLNEKIQWLKLYDRTNLHTRCADKYKVREYVKSKIGESYLVPLVFETKNVRDLIPDNFPDYPVIIKTNHDSSGGVIVRNKAETDWKRLQKHFNKLLKSNYYYKSNEWQYKNIERRLVVEKLLVRKDGGVPYDYKVHCFNNKAITIQVDIDRSGEHKRNWYSSSWKREPFWWSSLKSGGRRTDPAKWDVDKPECLPELIRLSEILSQEFIYVRADWYIVDNWIYFGELSFHHDGGLHPIWPKEWDYKLGQLLKLPIDESRD
ncbi:ATP-grasp fold amidoligase family protein [uncultured Draconibacterium sp.]|uniref:ATP-grasp fold amidoligase family protein n=1 Tax=uncultured Draconibacterium sp. TaxID=1573823 RepID=UPI0029C6D30F|nr:ATP-grasp fold amidoligase family protein [uncultured Draconibacterium sp.]